MKYSSQNTAFPPVSHCSLSEVFDRIHYGSSVPTCSYLLQLYLSVPSKSCRQTISPENCADAKSHFAMILSVLSKKFREPGDKALLSNILDDLANTTLCLDHMGSAKEARDQWYTELNGGGVLSKMKATYGNFLDGNFSDEEEDSDDVDVNEKGTPVLHVQSSSIKWVLCKPGIHESAVAENVTQLLESKLEGLNSRCGWIYIFSTDAEGMFKIGFSTRPPSLHRFAAHTACYKHFKEIMTALIPYARLVEQLVLTELASKRCRLAEKCKCRNIHREWLMIDQHTLLRTVEKWIQFIETYPYSANGVLKKGLVLPSPALTRKRPQKSRSSTPKKDEDSTPKKGEDSTPRKGGNSTSKLRKESTTKKRDSTTKQRKDSTPNIDDQSQSISRDLMDDFLRVMTFPKSK